MAGASSMDSDFFDAVVTSIRSSSSRLISARSISEGAGVCADVGNAAHKRSEQAAPALSTAFRMPIVLASLFTIGSQYVQLSSAVLFKCAHRWNCKKYKAGSAYFSGMYGLFLGYVQ
jgi:hypothetical protein